MIQNTPPLQFFAANEIESYLSLIKPTSTTKYILIPMITPPVDFLWPRLTTKYTPTPIFTPDEGIKMLRTNLGDSSLGWTSERLGRVHEMMQRMNTVLTGVKFRIVAWSVYKLSFVRAKASIARVQATL